MGKRYRILDSINHVVIKEINLLPNQMLFRWLIVFLIFSIFPFLGGYYISKSIYGQECIITEKEYVVLTGHKSRPTEKGVKEAIKALNVKFPHIVYAQAVVESATFTSKLCKESNNLFGMRLAKSRINTADGDQFGFAYYESWYYSLLDYAFWQSTYASNIKTEDEYLDFIAKVYAEDPNYRNKIKTLANKHK